MEADPAGASTAVARLQSLRVPPDLADAYVWRAAAVLGRGDGLAARVGAVVAASEETLLAANAPLLTLPEYSYNPGSRAWETHPQFVTLSTNVASYYRELVRVRREVGGALASVQHEAGANAALSPFRESQQRVSQWAAAAQQSWTRRWLTPAFDPPHPTPSLPEVLRLPLPGIRYTPAHLADLASLEKSKGEQLARGPCRPLTYDMESYGLYRIDCDNYVLNPAGPGARQFVEVRFVYRSQAPLLIRDDARPVELYYSFPVPAGVDAAGYRMEAMRHLFEAVGNAYPGRTQTPRGGPPTDGFVLTGPVPLKILKPMGETGLNSVVIRVVP
jgi:hypothetical protein